MTLAMYIFRGLSQPQPHQASVALISKQSSKALDFRSKYLKPLIGYCVQGRINAQASLGCSLGAPRVQGPRIGQTIFIFLNLLHWGKKTCLLLGPLETFFKMKSLIG